MRFEEVTSIGTTKSETNKKKQIRKMEKGVREAKSA